MWASLRFSFAGGLPEQLVGLVGVGRGPSREHAAVPAVEAVRAARRPRVPRRARALRRRRVHDSRRLDPARTHIHSCAFCTLSLSLCELLVDYHYE